MAKQRKKKHVTGHQGRGKPKTSRKGKRLAYGFVAQHDTPSESVVPQAAGADENGTRLNKWLAEAGIASRRKCDAMVLEGVVDVNGEIVLEPGRRIFDGDEVRVEGRVVKEVRRLYYLFYKPKGVLCTNDPRETRLRVCDLVDPVMPSRVFTVGRLDEASEGLLLLTNDGEFSQLMTHPSFGVRKTYAVRVDGLVDFDSVEKLRKGAFIDGAKVVPLSVRVGRRTKAFSTVEITIREGRNREVRRLLARSGLKVRQLKRVRIGSLGVKGVKRGGYRPLSRQEVEELVSCAREGDE